HIVAGTPVADCQHEIDAFLDKFVKQRQQASIHAVVHEKTPKTFGNFLKQFQKDQSPSGGDVPGKK
ncbi:MAG: hypothetical protein U0894_04555, partial [Pirellulales bacterium]